MYKTKLVTNVMHKNVIPDMTYYVFGGTFSLIQSINLMHKYTCTCVPGWLHVAVCD